MLNELLALERSLSAYGYVSTARHPDLSQLLKGDVIRVRLAANGAIDEVELLDGETRPDIWTLRDGKHNGFPGLKTGRGLLDLDQEQQKEHDDRWKTARSAAAKRSEIKRAVATAGLHPKALAWPEARHRARIRERLTGLLPLSADAATRAVPAVFQRFLTTFEVEPPFLRRLRDALLDRVQKGEDEWLDIIRAALVKPVPLAMDVTRDFARDAGDARQIEAVSRALSERAPCENSGAGSRKACALSGSKEALLQSNFPQPTLPSLGQTYLFSRNTDIPALARYGCNGPSSMPVEENLAGRFADALMKITAKERQGKTWRLLPAPVKGAQDLLIAFVAAAMDAAVTNSLCDGEDEDEDGGTRSGPAQVEQAASRLMSLWQAVAGKARPGELARILILRTVDPGNRKAVYDRSPTVDMLHEAAKTWTTAMRNTPGWIGWTVFKDKKVFEGRPSVQPPLSLISLSRKFFVRGGRSVLDAPGVSGAEAMALFLDEGDRAHRARRVLRLLLDRQTVLLVGTTQAKLRGNLKDFDPQAVSRLDALKAVSWIAALLFLLGRTTEVYMADAGFKLGQLLSAADAVHMGYCAEVRDGDVPPTLVGNSVFNIAGRSPDRALGILQARWKPYHAWATTAVRPGERKSEKEWKIARAISQVRHATRVCEELHPALARMREQERAPDEAFRAELLLGYVAGINPEKKSERTAVDDKKAAA